LLERALSQFKMSRMHRIEGAAKKPDSLHQLPSLRKERPSIGIEGPVC
jgi:hypothetical protein